MEIIKINSITNKYYMHNQSTCGFFSVKRNPEKNLEDAEFSYETINAKDQQMSNELNNITDNGDKMKDELVILASLRKQFEMIRSQNINS